MLKSIEEIRVEKEEHLFYPPILDENATFAANFLTVEDSKLCYEVMRKVYEDIMAVGSTDFKLIEESMYQNKKGFFWFLEFYKELERLLEKEPLIIDLDIAPDEEEDKIEFYPPVTGKYIKRMYKPVPSKVRLRVNDSINKHRVKYIGEAYELENFRDGFPGWYLLKETTVFEKYDEKTNHRVRIDFKGGEFYYFLSGASDNWQQITEVPIEIDYVVAALLFRD